MSAPLNQKLYDDVLAALTSGCSMDETRQLVGTGKSNLYRIIGDLLEAGKLVKVGKGKYAAPARNEAAPVVEPKNGSALVVESRSQHVQLPDYMRNRKAVTLFISRGEDEISAVVRLELCIANHWLPIPVYGDLRLYLGENRPRWSETMEFYEGVSAYRVTLANGRQNEYAHNPTLALTIDRRV